LRPVVLAGRNRTFHTGQAGMDRVDFNKHPVVTLQRRSFLCNTPLPPIDQIETPQKASFFSPRIAVICLKINALGPSQTGCTEHSMGNEGASCVGVVDYRNRSNQTPASTLSSLVASGALCIVLFLPHPWHPADKPHPSESTLTTSPLANGASPLAPGLVGPIGGRR
jgi:hypothetical protein